MKSEIHAFCLLLAFAVGTLLYKAQDGDSIHVPTRCWCPETTKKVRGPFADFIVIKKGTHCSKDEIILTLKRDGSTACLSPEGRQGKILLRCYDRVNKRGGSKKSCLQRRGKRRQQKKSPGQTPKAAS
ncbi:hypothetical protein MATL_G00185580 [Megalops atlanticus]|uniref:Chemokine interleukin-8-like domain-containing protein n=1 Tax=Megalops atlanticus TaxID=7932 RepID=A0A9D3PMQ2_MEGAT|nr:hypothetical protein MATL_G00185580 [Megalops atlanticus]